MGYEPKVGDLCLWGDRNAPRATAVVLDLLPDDDVSVRIVEPADGDEPHGFFGCDTTHPAARTFLDPLRPDAVGQRVRHTGISDFGVTTERRDNNASGRPIFCVKWDNFNAVAAGGHNEEHLVRIADKAEPTRAESPKTYGPEPTFDDGWNPPQCGRPGHDPACLCDRGWVREAESEPKVHETWATVTRGRWVEATRNPAFPRLYERAYVVNGGPLMPTRELAIAAWRARR